MAEENQDGQEKTEEPSQRKIDKQKEDEKVLSSKDAKKMNRLYSVESDLSLAGGFADHRLRLSSSEMLAFSSLVLLSLLKSNKDKDSNIIAHLEKLSESMDSHKEWVNACTKDLLQNPKNFLQLNRVSDI